MQPPRNSRELTREQCEQLQATIRPMLRFLARLLSRIDQLHFPADDRLRREVQAAYDYVHGLNVVLHYMTCDRAKREQQARPAGPPIDSLNDPYWKSRQKRKG